MRRSCSLLALGLAALTSGCALGPSYRRPDVAVPSSYIQAEPTEESIANLPWWEVFEDPVLQELIETALRENKDVGIAFWRIAEARAQLGIVRADQFPTVTGTANAGRGRLPRHLIPNAGVNNHYILAGDVSYEVDLWGRYRRATESARAQLLATEEARRVVLFTLISDVASLYFQLRDLDAKLEISRRTLKGRQDSLALVTERFNGGVVPQLDVHQAEIEEATAAAAVPTYERQIAEVEDALNLLLGRYPGPIPRGRPLDEQVMPPEVPTGLPSELLERRPDIRQVEEELHAQTAQIGVAQAMRFPSFSLNGTRGLFSFHWRELFWYEALFWNFSGTLTQTIFDFGRKKQQVEVEKARTEQALLEYEKTIQQAVAEVESALTAIATYRREREVRLRQVEAARGAATLSRARYDGGVTTYLEVLDSERSLFNAELDASTALQGEVVGIVRLYKALGGGWDADRPRPPAPAEEESGRTGNPTKVMEAALQDVSPSAEPAMSPSPPAQKPHFSLREGEDIWALRDPDEQLAAVPVPSDKAKAARIAAKDQRRVETPRGPRAKTPKASAVKKGGSRAAEGRGSKVRKGREAASAVAAGTSLTVPAQ